MDFLYAFFFLHATIMLFQVAKKLEERNGEMALLISSNSLFLFYV